MGALAIAVCLIAVITTTFASASEDENTEATAPGQQMQNGPDFKKPPMDPEFQAKLAEVMNSGDYDAWVSLMEEKVNNSDIPDGIAKKLPKITEIITEDEFAQFVAAWKLKEEGRALMEQAKAKMDEARTIEESLGLTRPEGHPGNRGLGKGFGLKKQIESNQDSEQDTQE